MLPSPCPPAQPVITGAEVVGPRPCTVVEDVPPGPTAVRRNEEFAGAHDTRRPSGRSGVPARPVGPTDTESAPVVAQTSVHS